MTVCLSRIVFGAFRSSTRSYISRLTNLQLNTHLPRPNDDIQLIRVGIPVRGLAGVTTRAPSRDAGSSLKQMISKKDRLDDVSGKEGHFLTLAYATADAYDLKSLKEALLEQRLYEPGTLKAEEVGDVVVASAVYSVGAEPREIVFFRDGATVFWNCSELEASNVLDFVRPYEIDRYPRDVVEKEKEVMTYVYLPNAKKCYLHETYFVLVPERDNSLERYTFSHAMAQSARLGAWESRLEALAAGVRAQASALAQRGARQALAHGDEVVRRLGELYSLRHRLTVESELLDTPDRYWEQDDLERLYSSTIAFFTVPRRTSVLSQRLAHCAELLQLVSGWVSDRHHVRLEWMVIALILAEVCFELLHCFERYYDRNAATTLAVVATDM